VTALILLFVGGGLLLCVLSVPLLRRKVPSNGWYGVRLPATLRDEALWYRANAYAGKCLLVAGLIFTLFALVLPFVPGMALDTYSWIMLVVLAATLLPALTLIARDVRRSPRETTDRA
jgi:uncharacterized membrane protein